MLRLRGVAKLLRQWKVVVFDRGSSELDAFLKVFDRQPFERQTSDWGEERFEQLEKGERN